MVKGIRGGTGVRGLGMSRREFLGLVAVGSAGLGLLGAGGCGVGSASSSEDVIRVALVGTRDDAERRAQLIPGFKEKFPGVDVEYIPIQALDWQEFLGKVLTMMAAGTPPDITFVATEGTHLFAGEGLAAPLDEYVKRDREEMAEYFSDVHPSLVEAMMYEGSLYELPVDFNAANMYYNTSLFDEVGVGRPDAEWDFEDFARIGGSVRRELGVSGYGWVNRLWGGLIPWLFVNGSNLLVEEKAPGGEWLWDTFYADDPAARNRGGGWRWPGARANDPANIEALEFVAELRNEDISPTPEVGGGGTLQGFFTSGQIAMTPAGGFWAGVPTDSGMERDGFDVQYFPKWKNQRHQFGTAGYVLMEASEKKDLAWEYIKYLSSKEAISTELGLPSGTWASTPVRRSMLTADRYEQTGPDNWEVFYGTLDEYPDTGPIPAPQEVSTMTNLLISATSRVMAGEATAKVALDDTQTELEELLA